MLFRTLTPLPITTTGQVFLHSMPGRYELLEYSLSEIKELGISLVVSFAGTEERLRKSPDYAAAVEAGSLPCEFLDHPVPDYGVPDDSAAFAGCIGQLAEAVRGGQSILIHCAAGIGRTGMAATCLLIALGSNTADAHATARDVGSGAETPEQRNFVLQFAGNHTP